MGLVDVFGGRRRERAMTVVVVPVEVENPHTYIARWFLLLSDFLAGAKFSIDSFLLRSALFFGYEIQ